MKQARTKTQAEVERCWPSIGTIAPCQNSCPLDVNVPSYIMALAHGNFDQALSVITENNPFAAVCGRVCNHPCEDACLRGEIDQPISIRALKRYITDNVPRNRDMPIKRTEPSRREKVAVIGSGPAGLTAVHDLALLGYPVTLFEALPVLGGMLNIGIPEFILPREVLHSEISAIEGPSIEIKTGSALGKEFGLDDLFQQGYKAIFLSIGAQLSSKLNLAGIDLPGVFYALPFLREANMQRPVKLTGKVAIIGGGNVAIDCARVAIRSGASEVNITCLESRTDMPAFPWEIERAEEEGIKMNPSLAPQTIIASNGQIAAIELSPVESIVFDNEGRIKPVIGKGQTIVMDTDSVIVAIGQTRDLSCLDGKKEVAMSNDYTVLIDPDTLATSIPGVFAGGDITNVATVVDAVAAGKKAAISVNKYLSGMYLPSVLPTVQKQVVTPDKSSLPQFVAHRQRADMPLLPHSQRISSYVEVETGLSRESAVAEASRCLNCSVCGNCIFDRSQMCYETANRLF